MDAASIEEINRLRLSMGMKPLTAPSGDDTSKPKESTPSPPEDEPSTFESRQAEATTNYQKIRDAEAAKKQRDERSAAIKKARDKAQRFRELEGKGLGDLDNDDGDTKAWLKNQKKRQKKIEKARKLEEAQAAEEAETAKSRDYTSEDLTGLKVGHDMANLDGDDQVLTLKDSNVLGEEDDGDELENVQLREQEKLNDKLDLKKKKPVYDPNDFDESGDKSVLAQYDEEIYGKKKKNFTLSSRGEASGIDDIINGPPVQKSKATISNLDDEALDLKPSSDYLDVSEVKVKKPKRKKAKSSRKRAEEDVLFDAENAEAVEEQTMDVDSESGAQQRKRKITDDTFVDDDDLQASLALQRNAALKKRKRTRPEDLVKQIQEESMQNSGQELEEGQNGGGLVIDEISEFVGTLKRPEDEPDVKTRRSRTKSAEPVTAMDGEPEDVEMEGATIVKQEPDETAGGDPEDIPATGVEEEKTVGQGMGATLSILKERGMVKNDSENSDGDLNTRFREQQKFLAEKNRRPAKIDEDARLQRERDRANGTLDRMSVREREEYSRKQNERREFQASKIMQDMFNEGYKPNFNIRYIDDHGRELDRKEAFKHLSHQFHGKGSGKGKTDRRLKKIGDEKRREAQNVLDSSQNVGMSSATAQQTKKRREAGVRLA